MEYAYFHQQKSWISTLHDCKGRIQLRRFTVELANFPKALSVITAIIRRVGHWRGWRGTTWSGVWPPGAPCSAWSPWTWDIKHYKVTWFGLSCRVFKKGCVFSPADGCMKMTFLTSDWTEAEFCKSGRRSSAFISIKQRRSGAPAVIHRRDLQNLAPVVLCW